MLLTSIKLGRQSQFDVETQGKRYSSISQITDNSPKNGPTSQGDAMAYLVRQCIMNIHTLPAISFPEEQFSQTEKYFASIYLGPRVSSFCWDD